jgi:hypothetical protein
MTRPATRAPRPVRSALFCLLCSFCLCVPAWAGWTHVSARGSAFEKTSDTNVSLADGNRGGGA